MGNTQQLNHRMHNKLMVADNRFAIVGGRNIGNEYFGLNPKQNFTDFDILAIGPAANARRELLISTPYFIPDDDFYQFDTPPVQSKAFGLHAKYIVIDRRYTFAGSLNLDPRSIYINTEMGLIIDSPTLAASVAQEFEEELKPENSWQVLLDDSRRLYWTAGDISVQKEPARSSWHRFQAWFLGLFDLDDQL